MGERVQNFQLSIINSNLRKFGIHMGLFVLAIGIRGEIPVMWKVIVRVIIVSGDGEKR